MMIQDIDNDASRSRGAKKGENRFKKNQVEKIVMREAIVIKELEKLEKNFANFSKVTYLASHVASVITSELALKRPVATSTLMRNDIYKVHLLEYMKRQNDRYEISSDLEAVKQRLKQSNHTASTDRQIRFLEEQVEKLSRENKTLKEYISNQGQPRIESSSKSKDVAVIEYNSDVNKLCEVIDMMLRKSQNRYQLSDKGVSIMPRAVVIADNDLIKPYLDWRAERVINKN